MDENTAKVLRAVDRHVRDDVAFRRIMRELAGAEEVDAPRVTEAPPAPPQRVHLVAPAAPARVQEELPLVPDTAPANHGAREGEEEVVVDFVAYLARINEAVRAAPGGVLEVTAAGLVAMVPGHRPGSLRDVGAYLGQRGRRPEVAPHGFRVARKWYEGGRECRYRLEAA